MTTNCHSLLRSPAHRQGDGLSTAIRQARDRQRVGTGAAPRLQPGLRQQARSRRRIQRQGDGYPLDQSRIASLRYLRRERQQSRAREADAAHVAVMLQLRLMEKKRELVRRSDVDELIDCIAGVTLTALSSQPAVCAARRSCGPTQHRACRVRGAHRDGQCLPADG